MKIHAISLEFANCSIGNKPWAISFYVPDSDKKLSPLSYQTYKLRTNLKDKKLSIYNLVVKYYKVGTPEEWLQLMEATVEVIKGQDIQDGDAVYSLVKSLPKGDALQVFKNKKESQEIKDDLTFTKCLLTVTKHVFPKKAYKMQKKWILQMIKLNDYLAHFLILDGGTATKISCKEFVDVLEDGISYQWKLEFEKE
eukprot:10254498-Ditylum_brightwellii.AAC.1